MLHVGRGSVLKKPARLPVALAALAVAIAGLASTAPLATAGSNADVQIVALADRGPGYDRSRGDWQTTKLFHATQA